MYAAAQAELLLLQVARDACHERPHSYAFLALVHIKAQRKPCSNNVLLPFLPTFASHSSFLPCDRFWDLQNLK